MLTVNKLLVLIILLCSILSLSGMTDSHSMRFADSYFSRAKSSSALHWNPANIGAKGYMDIPFLNTNIEITNNLFNLDMNGLSGKYLTDKDKEDLLAEIDGSFVVDGSLRTTLYGMSKNNIAFGLGVNGLITSKITDEFIRIALYGTESDTYHFTKQDLDYEALGYVDITAGMGGFKLNKLITKLDEYPAIPEIEYGFSGSILAGLGNVKVTSFEADYRADADNGLYAEAFLNQKEAFGGVGLKFNFSLNSQINENLSAGMGFDNVLGFIKWVGNTKSRQNRYWIEDVYISDLEDDILSDEDEVNDISGYTTNLPLIYRLGTLYDFGKIDLSFDYSHTFNDNRYNLGRNSISFATEMRWIKFLPVQIGVKIGDGDNAISTAYGLSYRGSYFESGVSMQVADTLLPGKNSKSLAFGIHTQLSFK